MKEIKFRGRSIEIKEWVYGYYAMRSEESPVPETNELYCEHYILIDNGIQGFNQVEIDINTLCQYTGLKDKNGVEIYEGNIFTFDYLKELDNTIQLIGSFVWNDDELRYEIDIYNNEEYVCLSYVSNGVMSNFEVYETPELLK